MRETTDDNGIKKVFGPITIDSVGAGLSESKWQAQLRQEVTSVYPAGRGSDSLSDNLFADNEFGEGQSYVEKRVTWVSVPKGTSQEKVQEMLNKYPNAVLQRILALEPILSEEQIRAMDTGLSTKTLEDYKENFVKNPETGEAILYANQVPQYRAIKFKTSGEGDIDNRSADFDRLFGAAQMAEPAVVPTGEQITA